MSAQQPGERLRNASAAVYRAMATRPGRRVADDPTTQLAGTWQILLAEAPARGQWQMLPRWRGRLDAFALRARLSDAQLYERHAPSAASARALYSLLEQSRVETLGARRYAGVRANLAALAQERWVRARPEAVNRNSDPAWVETFALLARAAIGAPLPDEAQLAISGCWNSWMSGAEAREVERLAALLDDQAAYARQSLQVIDAMHAASNDEQPQLFQPDRQRTGAEQDSETSSGATSRTQPADTSGSQADAAEGEVPSPAAGGDSRATYSAAQTYRVFTTEFDRVVSAQDLVDVEALARGRVELNRLIGNRLASVHRWAHRLQRKLLGWQMRAWQFDCEEGELDGSRLTRVATHPLESLVYKMEAPAEFPDTVVSLLVDNSGSMRGLPIATAAVCAELLGRVLERCGVQTEILGFTTRNWRGGQSCRAWAAAGRENDPGRLADLLHIVYKNVDDPWRRAHCAMGAMLAPDLLKENVDGEALLWAYERLLRRPAPRKILMVISDGAPLEDATLQANDPGYLDRHLRAVIDTIESGCSVELAAIGIGHDASRYYRRAVNVRDADSLGEALVTELLDLFDEPLRTRRARSRPFARALQ
jgi:cobaltochelatase CobT